jgi:hypothetical protein
MSAHFVGINGRVTAPLIVALCGAGHRPREHGIRACNALARNDITTIEALHKFYALAPLAADERLLHLRGVGLETARHILTCVPAPGLVELPTPEVIKTLAQARRRIAVLEHALREARRFTTCCDCLTAADGPQASALARRAIDAALSLPHRSP